MFKTKCTLTTILFSLICFWGLVLFSCNGSPQSPVIIPLRQNELDSGMQGRAVSDSLERTYRPTMLNYGKDVK